MTNKSKTVNQNITSMNARILEYSNLTKNEREELRTKIIKERPYMIGLDRIQAVIKLKALQKVEIKIKKGREIENGK